MQVALEKPTVWAGDVVRGKLLLHNATSPINYNEVYVEFFGEESNWWQETFNSGFAGGYEAGSDFRDEYRVYGYTADIIKVKLPLAPPEPGTLPLGSYEFPFAFAVPRDLPGTMKYDSVDARAYVEYRVRAKIGQPGLLNFSLRASADLRVLQRAPRVPRPLRAKLDSQLTQGCCCFQSAAGTVSFALESPADIYVPGKSGGVPFSAALQNGTSTTITGVEASLVKVLAFYNRQGQLAYVDSNPVARRRLQLPGGGVPPGGSATFKNVGLPLNPRAEPTIDGRLVKVYYELRVEAKTDGGFLMNKPTIAPRVVVAWDPLAYRSQPPPPPAGGGKPGAPAPPPAPPRPGKDEDEAAGQPLGPPAWNQPGWAPVKRPAALYQVEGAGSVKKLTQTELDAIAAALAESDAADAAAIQPSAPPPPEEGDEELAAAVEAAVLPHDAGGWGATR